MRALGEKAFHAALDRAFHESRRSKGLSNAVIASIVPEWPDLTPREWTPWPARAAPQDVSEFWQYVALALNDAGQPIPEFMQPVTRLDETISHIRDIASRTETARWEKGDFTIHLQHSAGSPGTNRDPAGDSSGPGAPRMAS